MALVDCDQTPRPSKAVDVPRLSIQEIVENIYRIINEHSLQDLIELSNIIGSYRSFLDERVIWEAIYQRSTRPRPPGPYDWQSTSELAQALINSAKVTVNWPEVSNYPKVISRRYIPVDPDAIGLSVLFDRWIMYAVGSKLLWYGLDSDHGDEKILFDAGEGRRIECLRTTGKILYNGRAAAFALIFVGHEMMIAKIRFAAGQPLDIHTVLRTQLHGWDASSQLTNVFLHHRLLIVAVAYGDESLCQKQFVIDARTLCQYHLAKSAWDKAIPKAVDELITNIFETKTHVVKARSVLVRRLGWRSFLECFPIPHVDHPPENHVLSASHKGRVADILMQTPFVIHESSPDPLNGEIEFALAGLAENIHRDVSVSSLSTATIRLESNGGISCIRTDIMGMPLALSLCLDSSNGNARGLCGTDTDDEFKLMAFSLDYNPQVISFSCSEVMEMEDDALSRKLVAFDAFGGTAYLDTKNEFGRCVEIKNFAIDLDTEVSMDRTPAESAVFFREYEDI